MGLEFEVRVVGGIDNCFVSLPLSLIQMLQQGTSSSGILTLDLRSLSSKDSWLVSWSGASSSSSAIEVSQQFADCISLPNHIKVQVRIGPNVPNATFVTIEPLTEDDWEVLELNSEHAEAAILKQVRILRENMKFPLWLHGKTVVTFFVVSTLPAGAAVQLVPGTEVAVAPKRRAKKKDTDENCHKDESFAKGDQTQRAFLRVQDADMTLVHKTKIKDLELGIVLTSVAYIHPETAKRFALSSLNSVILEPCSSKKKKNMNANNMNLEMKSNSNGKEGNGRISTEKESRHAIVSILTSLSVSIGHIMISQELRLYLGAGLHSWVLVKRENIKLNRSISLLSISPANLRLLEGREPVERKDATANIQNRRKNNVRIKDNPGNFLDVEDWPTHDRVIDALTDKLPYLKESDGEANDSNKKKGLQKLVKAWFLAHLEALSSSSQEEVKSIVVGSVSLLHFEFESLKPGFKEKLEPSSRGSSGNRKKTVNQPIRLLFLLTMHGESTTTNRGDAYEILLDAPEGKHDHLGILEVLASKLDLAAPISISSIKEKISDNDITSDLSSLSWMQVSATEVVNRLTVLLSSASGVWFSKYRLPLPGHVLIVGPPGSGKTLLSGAVARTFENNADILAHIVFVRCSVFAREKAGDIRQKLSGYVSEALDHAPSLVVFDDLDSIISLPSELEGSQFSTSINELTDFLTGILDEYGEKRNYTCGIGAVAFVATVKSVDKVPQSLIRSGRFDFHVELPTPASEREAILKHEIYRRSLDFPQEGLQDVATRCDGYAAYDLETLVDRAIHVAKRPVLSQASSTKKPEKLHLLKDDFSRAMIDFIPVAMRDITKSTPEGSRSGWGDVGGLHDIRSAIEEMIELPSKFPNIFARSPLRLRSNVLLYGPPGCGKTHIVGAAAAACSLRFISVKGPELLNKYIGASEQAVRDIFSKATAAAPCLLFFDEFESIAPKRGHDNTGVTDRVVNQFLTELDGVEVLTGVFVFAATSRPDLLDAALLRPGRLDRLLFCDFPSTHDRLDILRVLSRKLPLESDVNLEAIADMTEGFSGADLQALLSDAEIGAVHHLLDTKPQQLEEEEEEEQQQPPIISDALLQSVASKARPSVPDSEKDRLYSIYNQFLDSKKSTSSSQRRDAKGKRATLA